jgi:septal ring factor EnvC (AmiA/AmiB activator)
LIEENDSLQLAINQTEKDTIEVITFLKKKDTQKDEEVSTLKALVRELRQGLHKDWETKENDLKTALNNLEVEVAKKDQEISMMQGELKTMREFRRKRAELQEQLEAMQEGLESTKYEHKQQLIVMEEKFFEEKVLVSFFLLSC